MMTSKLGDVGANNVEGTINVVVLFNEGVIVGVDSRGMHPISNHIVSDRIKKFHHINGIFTTMGGSHNVIHKVWKAIELEVEKNYKNGIPTTVEMAANYAVDFVKSDQDLKPCKLYIIGNNEEKNTNVWLLVSKPKEKVLAKIDTWSIIGKGAAKNEEVEAELGNYKFQMSEDEALQMVKLTILIAALENNGMGGHVIIHKVTSTATKLIACESVPKVLLSNYDRIEALDNRTIFVLSLNHIDDESVFEWLRSGSVISPVELWNSHTIGQVRGGYNLRRVVLKVDMAADICRAVSVACEDAGVASRSTDPIIKSLPFVSFCNELFYFVEASKCMLETLCADYI